MVLRRLAAALFLLPAAALAGAPVEDLEAVFRGMTLDGVYADGLFFSETYFEDGLIRYHDATGADSGEWSVRDGMFCTFYETQQGACFFVRRDGENCFTFYESVAGEDGSLAPRPDWTSRGWDRSRDPTCPENPEAVI